MSHEARRLRVVCFGMNSRFSLLPFAAVAGQHDVVGVVEGLSRGVKGGKASRNPVGPFLRALSRRLNSHSLYRFAKCVGANYLQLRDDNQGELADFVRSCAPDVICICSFPRLIKANVFRIPQLGTINLHASLLPKYRGPNTWFWMYYDMVQSGGVTVHYVDEGEDTGDILLQGEYPIDLGMTSEEMWTRAISVGKDLVVEALEQIAKGTSRPRVQRDLPTNRRARKVGPDEQLIDWDSWSVQRVFHLLRGTHTWYRPIASPGPMRTWEIVSYDFRLPAGDQRPGTITRETDGKHYLVCSDGRILLSPRWTAREVVARVLKRVT